MEQVQNKENQEKNVKQQEKISFEDKENYTLRQWGKLVFETSDPDEKARITNHAVDLWEQGKIQEIGELVKIENPTRPQHVICMPPQKMPRKKNNKEGLGMMLHSLVHVENIAIELSWDIVMRFCEKEYKLPKQFFDDWLRIAKEEAKHYHMIKERMEAEYGKTYGDYPVHDRLWEDAIKTNDNLLNRLVLEHCVHEGRGVDVTHFLTIPRFESDKKTQELLRDVILKDEVTHVRDGLTWFKHICKEILGIKEEQDIIKKFHETVQNTLMSKQLTPPFQKELRLEAGMTEEYYLPIAKEDKKQPVK
ncbi:Ferritin-like superfamily [Pseudocohnilembus persalinus]|uniref:Ferritin-like superfamily n=1 Tax=Pseudocohnilembus persalinus TaxID=266149 RepID=A0A0V0R6J2_PSEPJ|nr:Ferritin-like superfamily [Pseudocohnilembus persalinus]|eukprot:KRX10103.1 Ferritin-like superfamily [Pseudocohnilembus persalinus]